MTRRVRDHYQEEAWMVEALCARLALPVGTRVLEPCSGAGGIASILRAGGAEVVTNDLDPAMPTDFHVDARTARWPPLFDWAISNPPFSDALAILDATIQSVPNIAFLLRLSFLEPTQARRGFLRSCPPTGLLVLPRFSFTRDGKTDSVTAAWMIWQAGVRAGAIEIAAPHDAQRAA